MDNKMGATGAYCLCPVLRSEDTEETHSHLFFQCAYSKFVQGKLLNWMGYSRQIGHWDDEIAWLTHKANNRSSKGAVVGFVFATIVYHLWLERKDRRIQQISRRSYDIIKEIALQLHLQARDVVNESIHQRGWLLHQLIFSHWRKLLHLYPSQNVRSLVADSGVG